MSRAEGIMAGIEWLQMRATKERVESEEIEVTCSQCGHQFPQAISVIVPTIGHHCPLCVYNAGEGGGEK